MRIALLTDGIYPYVIGGMQKHSFYLAKYFAINKIEVDLYHTAADKEEATELNCFSAEEKKYINSIFVPFKKLDRLPGHYIREMYHYSENIYELLRKNPAVDFIYVQGLCGTKLLESGLDKKVPVGVNFHGLEMFQSAANLRSKLEQYLFKGPVTKCLQKADVVFSLGGKLTELILQRGVPKEKISQIPIGIDPGWIKTKPVSAGAEIKFVFVGRYERRKGIEELSSVLKELIKEVNIEFHFIGAIPESKQISSKQVHYRGAISDPEKIKSILEQSDVLVCPSYSEGMPTVILEAMACGLAVIASNVGAVSEQVSKQNGCLIEPGNIAELKNVILSFINMPSAQLIQMKQHSIEKIQQRFLWDDIIRATIEEIKKKAGI